VTGADVQLALRRIGSAAFGCRIGEARLNRYVRARRRDIAGLSIALKGNGLVVSAKPEMLGVISVPVSVQGRLVPRGGAALDFEPDRAKVSIVSIPQIILDYLTRCAAIAA